jgi:hypothetical protein
MRDVAQRVLGELPLRRVALQARRDLLARLLREALRSCQIQRREPDSYLSVSGTGLELVAGLRPGGLLLERRVVPDRAARPGEARVRRDLVQEREDTLLTFDAA